MIEYVTVCIKGRNVRLLADYFIKEFVFIGDVTVRGSNHNMILCGWIKNVDLNYGLKYVLGNFEGLEGEVI